MVKRRLPLNPSLEQLKNQARDLLEAYVSGDDTAVVDFQAFHPRGVTRDVAKLTDAQLVLARTYDFQSWSRLRLGAELSRAISNDALEEIRRLVAEHPELLVEQVRGEDSSWGPPLSFAANLGKQPVIDLLIELGADDVQFAFSRAVLQGKIDVARRFTEMGARPERGMVMLPCETVSGDGLAFLVEELGADLVDGDGNPLEPLRMVFETYSRNPEGKHRCLEVFERSGADLPDTAPMAFHRGRLDLLESCLNRDAGLLERRFSYEEIYPHSHKGQTGLHGTPLNGATLLHMAVDFDELEILEWLLEKGANPDIAAEVDGDGFGGHTPLFNTVVSQAVTCGRQKDARMARVLLAQGADPAARASLRKALRYEDDGSEHVYRDVTPLEWGERFHGRRWVNERAMQAIRESGGQ